MHSFFLEFMEFRYLIFRYYRQCYTELSQKVVSQRLEQVVCFKQYNMGVIIFTVKTYKVHWEATYYKTSKKSKKLMYFYVNIFSAFKQWFMDDNVTCN